MEKLVILDILKKSIHNLLQEFKNENDNPIDDSHITQSLCSSIEAMFLHGQVSNQTAGFLSKFGRIRQPYEYDFWSFIVEFIPRNLVETMKNHDFKLTQIGLCRIWLRISLNESIILSYLESMIKDEKRLKQFYSKESLIRDEELMGAFCGLLKSIEHLIFRLDISLPILNSWVNSDALQISGLQHHVPAKLNIQSTKPRSLDNIQTDSSSISDCKSLSFNLLDEEEILPTSILLNRVNNSVSASSNLFLQPDDSEEHFSKRNIDVLEKEGYIDQNKVDYHIGEALVTQLEEVNKKISVDQIVEEYEVPVIEIIVDHTGPNFCKDISDDIKNECFEVNPVENQSGHVLFNLQNEILENGLNEIDFSTKEIVIKSTSQDSFDQLWPECNSDHLTLINELDVDIIKESPTLSNNEFSFNDESTNFDDVESSKVYSLFASQLITHANDLIHNLLQGRFFKVKESDQSWVFIGDELLSRNAELKKLMELFPGVTESSAQLGENSVFGGLCHKCHRSLETNNVFLDYYDGQLYCFNCESKTKAVIPRDVILNWDFTPKSVSETTKKFLSEIMLHPNINLATNSCLFDVIPELARVRKLRHKLSLLWLQVTSCDIETSSKVRQAMFPREYMLASVKEKDLYSLEDLIILQNGVLEKTLLYVIDKIAIPHVNKCLVCRMKALPCDKCRDENNLIYIHDIEYYSECSTRLCQSVIHNRCKNPSTKSFYCRRCVKYLENQQPITLDSYDTADMID